MNETSAALAQHILSGADDIHIVFGPLVTDLEEQSYFTIATAGPGKEFRADLIYASGEDRTRFIFELAFERPPLVIHDTDDEAYMARLCETLWPGERITALRQAVEAELSCGR